MLKNLMGKKDGNQTNEVNSDELKELRNKFKEISSGNPAAAQTTTAAPAENSHPLSNPNPAAQNALVDPERFEENERITNLIMQQIKELIEIDNNLNIKMKEMEGKIKTNISNVSDVKSVVDKFNQRLEFIEKNMEKFMGLYEVVTNRFNPFISESDNNTGESNNEPAANVNIPEVPGKEPAIAEPKVEEPAMEEKPVEPAAEEVKQEPVAEEKPAEPAKEAAPSVQIDNAVVQKIIDGSEAKGKFNSEQVGIVAQELDKYFNAGLSLDDNAYKEISGALTKEINKLVVASITKHTTVTNDSIIEAIKAVYGATSQYAEGTGDTPADTSAAEEVHPDFHFQLSDGTEIKSLPDLVNALESMDDAEFANHVNDEKNDFADWVGLVNNDEEHANSLRPLRTREEIYQMLQTLL